MKVTYNNYEVLKRCPLFTDVNEQDIESLLGCLSAKEKEFDKREFILCAGDKVSQVGIVLSGSVQVVQEDFWGNKTILTHIEPGGLFAEAFSCSGTTNLPVSVVALQSSRIMFVDYQKIVTTCSASCVFHTTLITNMMRVLAGKNILLTEKMEYITKKTIREKLLSFLSGQVIKRNSTEFEVPFNRQELAEFLSIDRSALSRELSKMQEEGILKYKKNNFKLL